MRNAAATYWIMAGIVAVVLAAWAWEGAKTRTTKESAERRATKAAINDRALRQLQSGPTTRGWQTPHGSLVEILLPTDRYGVGIVEIQRCIVWRDGETGTSSMHCDPEGIPVD